MKSNPLRFPRFFKLSTATVLCMLLPLNNIGFATPAYPDSLNLKTFKIPQHLGKIEETAQGLPNGKTILFIQDAHDSLEAQENIAKLVSRLVEKQGIQTVYEEGYEGPVPTDSYFGFIPKGKLRQKVSYFLLDKLRLGGAEYAHINRKKDFKLVGADNIKLHLRNIAAYRRHAARQKAVQNDLDSLLSEIRRLGNQHFPAVIKEWIRLRERFDSGELQLLDYLKRIEVENSPAIRLVLDAEKSQRAGIINEIEKLDPKQLFKEIEASENSFAKKHLTESQDLELFRYYRILILLKRLSEIRVTPSEYDAVRASLDDFRTQVLADFIAKTSGKPVLLSKRWEKRIRGAVTFYEIAQARNQAVADNLDSFLKNPEEKTAVLVFGGFHAGDIKRFFKERGISYAVISPRITKEDPVHQAYYKKLMTSQYHAFEVPLNVRTAAKPQPVLTLPRGRAEVRAIYENIYGLRGEPANWMSQVEQNILRSEARGDTDAAIPGKSPDETEIFIADQNHPVMDHVTLELPDGKTPRLIVTFDDQKRVYEKIAASDKSLIFQAMEPVPPSLGTVIKAARGPEAKKETAVRLLRLEKMISDLLTQRSEEAYLPRPQARYVLNEGWVSLNNSSRIYVIDMPGETERLNFESFLERQDIPNSTKLEIFIGIVREVRKIMDLGIVPSDLKASNVLVTEMPDANGNYVFKLIDLGLYTDIRSLAKQNLTELYHEGRSNGYSPLSMDITFLIDHYRDRLPAGEIFSENDLLQFNGWFALHELQKSLIGDFFGDHAEQDGAVQGTEFIFRGENIDEVFLEAKYGWLKEKHANLWAAIQNSVHALQNETDTVSLPEYIAELDASPDKQILYARFEKFLTKLEALREHLHHAEAISQSNFQDFAVTEIEKLMVQSSQVQWKAPKPLMFTAIFTIAAYALWGVYMTFLVWKTAGLMWALGFSAVWAGLAALGYGYLKWLHNNFNVDINNGFQMLADFRDLFQVVGEYQKAVSQVIEANKKLQSGPESNAQFRKRMGKIQKYDNAILALSANHWEFLQNPEVWESEAEVTEDGPLSWLTSDYLKKALQSRIDWMEEYKENIREQLGEDSGLWKQHFSTVEGRFRAELQRLEDVEEAHRSESRGNFRSVDADDPDYLRISQRIFTGLVQLRQPLNDALSQIPRERPGDDGGDEWGTFAGTPWFARPLAEDAGRQGFVSYEVLEPLQTQYEYLHGLLIELEGMRGPEDRRVSELKYLLTHVNGQLARLKEHETGRSEVRWGVPIPKNRMDDFISAAYAEQYLEILGDTPLDQALAVLDREGYGFTADTVREHGATTLAAAFTSSRDNYGFSPNLFYGAAKARALSLGLDPETIRRPSTKNYRAGDFEITFDQYVIQPIREAESGRLKFGFLKETAEISELDQTQIKDLFQTTKIVEKTLERLFKISAKKADIKDVQISLYSDAGQTRSVYQVTVTGKKKFSSVDFIMKITRSSSYTDVYSLNHEVLTKLLAERLGQTFGFLTALPDGRLVVTGRLFPGVNFDTIKDDYAAQVAVVEEYVRVWQKLGGIFIYEPHRNQFVVDVWKGGTTAHLVDKGHVRMSQPVSISLKPNEDGELLPYSEDVDLEQLKDWLEVIGPARLIDTLIQHLESPLPGQIFSRQDFVDPDNEMVRFFEGIRFKLDRKALVEGVVKGLGKQAARHFFEALQKESLRGPQSESLYRAIEQVFPKRSEARSELSAETLAQRNAFADLVSFLNRYWWFLEGNEQTVDGTYFAPFLDKYRLGFHWDDASQKHFPPSKEEIQQLPQEEFEQRRDIVRNIVHHRIAIGRLMDFYNSPKDGTPVFPGHYETYFYDLLIKTGIQLVAEDLPHSDPTWNLGNLEAAVAAQEMHRKGYQAMALYSQRQSLEPRTLLHRIMDLAPYFHALFAGALVEEVAGLDLVEDYPHLYRTLYQAVTNILNHGNIGAFGVKTVEAQHQKWLEVTLWDNGENIADAETWRQRSLPLDNPFDRAIEVVMHPRFDFGLLNFFRFVNKVNGQVTLESNGKIWKKSAPGAPFLESFGPAAEGVLEGTVLSIRIPIDSARSESRSFIRKWDQLWHPWKLAASQFNDQYRSLQVGYSHRVLPLDKHAFVLLLVQMFFGKTHLSYLALLGLPLYVLGHIIGYRIFDRYTKPRLEQKELITGGPYRYSQNPIYFSYFAGFAAFALLNPGIISLIAMLIRIYTEIYILALERNQVWDRFKDTPQAQKYIEYTQQTPLFIPTLRPKKETALPSRSESRAQDDIPDWMGSGVAGRVLAAGKVSPEFLNKQNLDPDILAELIKIIEDKAAVAAAAGAVDVPVLVETVLQPLRASGFGIYTFNELRGAASTDEATYAFTYAKPYEIGIGAGALEDKEFAAELLFRTAVKSYLQKRQGKKNESSALQVTEELPSRLFLNMQQFKDTLKAFRDLTRSEFYVSAVSRFSLFDIDDPTFGTWDIFERWLDYHVENQNQKDVYEPWIEQAGFLTNKFLGENDADAAKTDDQIAVYLRIVNPLITFGIFRAQFFERVRQQRDATTAKLRKEAEAAFELIKWISDHYPEPYSGRQLVISPHSIDYARSYVSAKKLLYGRSYTVYARDVLNPGDLITPEKIYQEFLEEFKALAGKENKDIVTPPLLFGWMLDEPFSPASAGALLRRINKVYARALRNWDWAGEQDVRYEEFETENPLRRKFFLEGHFGGDEENSYVLLKDLKALQGQFPVTYGSSLMVLPRPANDKDLETWMGIAHYSVNRMTLSSGEDTEPRKYEIKIVDSMPLGVLQGIQNHFNIFGEINGLTRLIFYKSAFVYDLYSWLKDGKAAFIDERPFHGVWRLLVDLRAAAEGGREGDFSPKGVNLSEWADSVLRIGSEQEVIFMDEVAYGENRTPERRITDIDMRQSSLQIYNLLFNENLSFHRFADTIQFAPDGHRMTADSIKQFVDILMALQSVNFYAGFDEALRTFEALLNEVLEYIEIFPDGIRVKDPEKFKAFLKGKLISPSGEMSYEDFKQSVFWKEFSEKIEQQDRELKNFKNKELQSHPLNPETQANDVAEIRYPNFDHAFDAEIVEPSVIFSVENWQRLKNVHNGTAQGHWMLRYQEEGVKFPGAPGYLRLDPDQTGIRPGDLINVEVFYSERDKTTMVEIGKINENPPDELGHSFAKNLHSHIFGDEQDLRGTLPDQAEVESIVAILEKGAEEIKKEWGEDSKYNEAVENVMEHLLKSTIEIIPSLQFFDTTGGFYYRWALTADSNRLLIGDRIMKTSNKKLAAVTLFRTAAESLRRVETEAGRPWSEEDMSDIKNLAWRVAGRIDNDSNETIEAEYMRFIGEGAVWIPLPTLVSKKVVFGNGWQITGDVWNQPVKRLRHAAEEENSSRLAAIREPGLYSIDNAANDLLQFYLTDNLVSLQIPNLKGKVRIHIPEGFDTIEFYSESDRQLKGVANIVMGTGPQDLRVVMAQERNGVHLLQPLPPAVAHFRPRSAVDYLETLAFVNAVSPLLNSGRGYSRIDLLETEEKTDASELKIDPSEGRIFVASDLLRDAAKAAALLDAELRNSDPVRQIEVIHDAMKSIFTAKEEFVPELVIPEIPAKLESAEMANWGALYKKKYETLHTEIAAMRQRLIVMRAVDAVRQKDKEKKFFDGKNLKEEKFRTALRDAIAHSQDDFYFAAKGGQNFKPTGGKGGSSHTTLEALQWPGKPKSVYMADEGIGIATPAYFQMSEGEYSLQHNRSHLDPTRFLFVRFAAPTEKQPEKALIRLFDLETGQEVEPGKILYGEKVAALQASIDALMEQAKRRSTHFDLEVLRQTFEEFASQINFSPEYLKTHTNAHENEMALLEIKRIVFDRLNQFLHLALDTVEFDVQSNDLLLKLILEHIVNGHAERADENASKLRSLFGKEKKGFLGLLQLYFEDDEWKWMTEGDNGSKYDLISSIIAEFFDVKEAGQPFSEGFLEFVFTALSNIKTQITPQADAFLKTKNDEDLKEGILRLRGELLKVYKPVTYAGRPQGTEKKILPIEQLLIDHVLAQKHVNYMNEHSIPDAAERASYHTSYGAAEGIGASSMQFRYGSTSFIIDAGVMIDEKNTPPAWPEFSNKKQIIFLTHDHLDHVGSVVRLWRDKLDKQGIFYATPETHKLLPYVLKSMARQDGISRQDIEEFMEAVQVLPENEWFEVAPDVKVRFHGPVGHLLGAASLIVSTPDSTTLITSDISISEQGPVPGWQDIPEEIRLKIDRVIIESTYGMRELVDRKLEEERLVRETAQRLKEGGKILFPAFANGRSQTILLLLLQNLKALTDQDQDLKIYLDGQTALFTREYVRAYPQVFAPYIEWMKKNLVYVSEKPKEGFAQREDALDRDSKQPTIIISSSGNASQGMSQWWAARLVNNRRNGIFFSGYMDPEETGSRLLELAKKNQTLGVEKEFRMSFSFRNDVLELPVRSHTAEFKLSGHTSGMQMIERVLLPIGPSLKEVIIQHGGFRQRREVYDWIKENHPEWNPKLIRNGQSYQGAIPYTQTVLAERKQFFESLQAKPLSSAVRSEIRPQGMEDRAPDVSAGKMWTENRRPNFMVKPEQVILYHKRAGESLDRDAAHSIWQHLPWEFKAAELLTSAAAEEHGIVALTMNQHLREYLAETTLRVPLQPQNGSRLSAGHYRAASWPELMKLLEDLNIGKGVIDLTAEHHQKAIREEVEDRKLVLRDLENPEFRKAIFESVFARPDLAAKHVEIKDLQHFGEGGFKRVYQVRVRLEGERQDFVFVIKVVKPEVKKSDSDFVYDQSYLDEIYKVQTQLRRQNIFLYPPSTPYFVSPSADGSVRYLSAEALVPASHASMSDILRDRAVLVAYMTLYRISNGKNFVFDPKRPNVLFRRMDRNHSQATMIDLDNIMLGTASPAEAVVQMREFGFGSNEIIWAVVQTLGSKDGLAFLRSASFVLSTYGYGDFAAAVKRFAESPHRREDSPAIPLSETISITLNGLALEIPKQVSLHDLLEDYSVLFSSMAIFRNERLLTPAGDFINPKRARELYGLRMMEGDAVTFRPRVEIEGIVPAHKERRRQLQALRKASSASRSENRVLRSELEVKERDLPGQGEPVRVNLLVGFIGSQAPMHGLENTANMYANRLRLEAGENGFERPIHLNITFASGNKFQEAVEKGGFDFAFVSPKHLERLEDGLRQKLENSVKAVFKPAAAQQPAFIHLKTMLSTLNATARSEARLSNAAFENKRILIDFKDMAAHFSDDQIKEVLYAAQMPVRNSKVVIYNLDITDPLGKFLRDENIANLETVDGDLNAASAAYLRNFNGEVVHLSSENAGITAAQLKYAVGQSGVPEDYVYSLSYQDTSGGVLGVGLQDLQSGLLKKQLPDHMEYNQRGNIILTDPSAAGFWQARYNAALAFSRAA